jgi:hypothetical protein
MQDAEELVKQFESEQEIASKFESNGARSLDDSNSIEYAKCQVMVNNAQKKNNELTCEIGRLVQLMKEKDEDIRKLNDVIQHKNDE